MKDTCSAAAACVLWLRVPRKSLERQGQCGSDCGRLGLLGCASTPAVLLYCWLEMGQLAAERCLCS